MSSTQRPPRRSARLAFGDDESPQVLKRSKVDEDHNGIKRVDGSKTGASKGRTKPSYDEEKDGFKFTRTRAKRSQARQTAEPQAVPVSEQIQAVNHLKSARSRRTFVPTPESSAPKNDEVPQRRSKRLSEEKEATGTTATPLKFKPGRRKTKALEPIQRPSTDREETPELVNEDIHVEKTRTGTKIALPFADTPVIQRNKEMRAKSKTQSRRSSSGLRGRRASSLIDSGASNEKDVHEPSHEVPGLHHKSDGIFVVDVDASGSPSTVKVEKSKHIDNPFLDILVADELCPTAVPHADVDTRDFYKHIEQSLLEPVRMKQLLLWCGSRAMPEKTARGKFKDPNEELASDSARQIQEELLKDFANKPEMSSWFTREDTAPTALVKKPNPRNAVHVAKLKELEAEIERLKTEQQAWQSILKSNSIEDIKPSDAASTSSFEPSSVDSGLLADPGQVSILKSLRDTTTQPTEISTRLKTVTASLEPTIDMFADGVHRIAQYRLQAERVADKVLGATSEKLEQREKEIQKSSGTAAVDGKTLLAALAMALGEQQ